MYAPHSLCFIYVQHLFQLSFFLPIQLFLNPQILYFFCRFLWSLPSHTNSHSVVFHIQNQKVSQLGWLFFTLKKCYLQHKIFTTSRKLHNINFYILTSQDFIINNNNNKSYFPHSILFMFFCYVIVSTISS